MTTYNKTTLKTFFQNGDVPTGTDYSNFIDSYVNIVETSEQDMAGALGTTELITPRVSATNVNVTGILSANTLSFTGTVSANQVNIAANLLMGASKVVVSGDSGNASFGGVVSAASLNVTGDVSAATGTIYASAMRSTNGFIGSVGIVSAAGTAQATAASLTFVVNRGKGITDGQTTGFTPLTGRPGLVQYLFNEGPSANLWPPTGGTINGLAANAAFAIGASAMITIIHLTASAYGAK